MENKEYENQLNDPTNRTKIQKLLTFVRAQVPFRSYDVFAAQPILE